MIFIFNKFIKKRYEKESTINGMEDLLTPGMDNIDPFETTPTSETTPTFEE